MTMRKIKTSEATDAALDWLVAKCLANVHEDALLNGTTMHGWWISGLFTDPNYWVRSDEFHPSTNWAQGGPIMDRQDIQWCRLNGQVEAWSGFDYIEWRINWDSDIRMPDGAGFGAGATILVAAMRCYVASKLGDEVEVPDELLE